MARVSSGVIQRRACERCRSAKARCDRGLPECDRCKSVGRPCVYSKPDGSLRIRNESAKAERNAVSAWRARANETTNHSTESVYNSTTLIQPFSIDSENFARHRFFYDFSESSSGFPGLSFGDLCRTNLTPGTAGGGLEAALRATSLVNFRKRHHDIRSGVAASSALNKAIGILRQSLQASCPEIPLNVVLTAILLGLHQNISHERHLIGSWVYHFRGSAHLLEAAGDSGLDEATYLNLSQLIEKQALCFSLSAGLPFILPIRMRKNLAMRTDLRARNLTLAASTADFCARVQKCNPRMNLWQRLELHKEFTSLDYASARLESELTIVLPYHSQDSHEDLFSKWYQIISEYSGAPRTIHQYAALQDVAIWNVERMARMKLLSLALDYELCDGYIDLTTSGQIIKYSEPAEVLRAKLLILAEDLCASIYYTLSHKADGLQPLSSFDDVAGFKAFLLVTPITVATQCLKSLPESQTARERLGWLDHILDLFSERLGISEAWCWKEGDEARAKAKIERELSFDR